ncbi:DUF4407 domain-containing protein [Micromonospora sp. NPDC000316]|uniref:DUF4407 domain-containing protein n=1 Tax=Micromonospora sp. NPDC000316 TaxID=3364216 RepID=UPI00369A4DA4
MPDNPVGIRRRVTYTGQVSPGFAALLMKYGASPRLVQVAREKTADPDRQVISTSETPVADTGQRAPRTGIGALLTRLAGADQELLSRLPSERPRFQTLGLVLITTSLFAALSMGVALHLATGSIALAIPVAAFWGVLVLTLDRSLVVSAIERSRAISRFWVLLPRLFMNIALGAVTATPLVLSVFETEIQAQIGLTRPDLAGQQIGILDRLVALDQLGKQSNFLQLAVWLVSGLLLMIEVMPSVFVLLARLRPAQPYEMVLEVKERYVVVDEEVSEIRKWAPGARSRTRNAGVEESGTEECDVETTGTGTASFEKETNTEKSGTEEAVTADPATVEQKIDALHERLDALVESLARQQEREFAEVIDIASRRRAS